MTTSPEEIERAVAVLRAGGLVAFPTETVYGLGADAANPTAVRRVFEVKGRPATHPLIVHLGSAAALDHWAVDVPPAARLLAEACWPGPLTVLLRRSPSVPDVVTGGRDTVGLRVPAHPLALALLERFSGGIAAPSANRFGRVSPTTAADVQADLGSDVDLVLDGGPCQVGVESTIVDLTGGEPEVLRPGGVSFERLEEVLGRPVGLWLGDRDVAAPGTLPAHYAPAARVEVLDEVSAVAERAAQLLVAGRRVAVLAPVALAGLPDGVVELEPAGGPESYARVLYGRLRQADRLGVEVVLAVPPERVGVGVAVRDRLMRAAAAGRAAPGHGSST
ncbi:L-threonylcarbamoyladenylate synthase [Rhabdothermincola sp.]|uniref:L-threonylcarbamoyladenylate synthase n=1 Tax=Rhabdothermincola sp. TaxID=2820405 RepID=UPI002FE2621B